MNQNIQSKKDAVKKTTFFFGTFFKNKKGVELTFNVIVILILLVIVLIIMIFFFVKYYGSNANSINNVGENAINMSKAYK